MSNDIVSSSKFISLVLRHRPDAIGLTLDAAGWAEIDALIRLSQDHRPLTRALIEEVVATNNKQRFAISEDGLRIRARQGHSIEVALGLTPLQPPEELFHGTATRFLAPIRREGLDKRTRQHVHLSADAQTAANVGARHGTPVVLRIRAGGMAAAGHLFYRSENGVWLTDAVPPQFILFGDEQPSDQA
jgi:putative RNA 2'-phosphotransferase